MKIGFKYKNGTPSFEKVIPNSKGWDSPTLEIAVEGNNGRNRQVATNDYILTMIYAFRNLINQHETEIESFEYTGTLLGDITTTTEGKDFLTSKNSKFDFVLFTMYKDFFNEQLYFTRNADVVTKGDGSLMFEGYKLNSKVIDPNTDDRKKDKRFLTSLLVTVSRYLPDYDLKYNSETKKIEYLYKGVPLNSIEDIVEDDVFLFFKLVEVLLSRGLHVGVYFLDCEFLSASVIKAMVAFINLFYLTNRAIFLYNVPKVKRKELSELNHEVVMLPNHKLSRTVQEKRRKKK